MTGQLTGYEETSVVEVGAVLDTSPATPEEVYLRTIGHSERAIAAVAAKRAATAGANFNGGTITEPIVVTPTGSPTDSLRVDAPTDGPADGSWVRVGDSEGATLAVNGVGQESLSVLSESLASDYTQMMDVSGGDGRVVGISTDGAVDVVLYQSDTNGLRVLNNASISLPLLRCAIAGLIFHLNTEPADAELSAGDCALWFDTTNGSAAFNIKAKQANGAIVTGSVALT